MAMTLEVVPQLMAMAQGGGEEKWNSAQVKSGTTYIAPNVLHTFQTKLNSEFLHSGLCWRWLGGRVGRRLRRQLWEGRSWREVLENIVINMEKNDFLMF